MQVKHEIDGYETIDAPISAIKQTVKRQNLRNGQTWRIDHLASLSERTAVTICRKLGK